MTTTIELRKGMNTDALVGRTFTTHGGLTLTVERAWHASSFSGVGMFAVDRGGRTAYGAAYGDLLIEG